MNMELLMQYVTYLLMASIGVFDQCYHTGNKRDAGVEKNPDKCSGTCGGLDLVPVGGCDSMYIL